MLANLQLIDSLIEDLNNAIKCQMGGQYILWCQACLQIVQKLHNLKSGVEAEIKNRDEIIGTLKRELRAAGREVIDIPAEEIIKNPDVLKEAFNGADNNKR